MCILFNILLCWLFTLGLGLDEHEKFNPEVCFITNPFSPSFACTVNSIFLFTPPLLTHHSVKESWLIFGIQPAGLLTSFPGSHCFRREIMIMCSIYLQGVNVYNVDFYSRSTSILAIYQTSWVKTVFSWRWENTDLSHSLIIFSCSQFYHVSQKTRS